MRNIPWLTTDAINFLDIFLKNKRDCSVLEFGAGASTVWMSKRTNNIISIEHEVGTVAQVRSRAHKKVDIRRVSRPYWKECQKFKDETFDLVLIDGRDRVACCRESMRLVRPNGIIMLDNAERTRYDGVREMLSDWKGHTTTQTKPDAAGFMYKGWRTDWWVKPGKEKP